MPYASSLYYAKNYAGIIDTNLANIPCSQKFCGKKFLYFSCVTDQPHGYSTKKFTT